MPWQQHPHRQEGVSHLFFRLHKHRSKTQELFNMDPVASQKCYFLPFSYRHSTFNSSRPLFPSVHFTLYSPAFLFSSSQVLSIMYHPYTAGRLRRRRLQCERCEVSEALGNSRGCESRPVISNPANPIKWTKSATAIASGKWWNNAITKQYDFLALLNLVIFIGSKFFLPGRCMNMK